MPGEVIDRPNPGASNSHIPDDVLRLSVQLEKLKISDEDLKAIHEFRRAANYIAAGEASLVAILLGETNFEQL